MFAAESSDWRSAGRSAGGGGEGRAKHLGRERNLALEILEEFAEASGYGAHEPPSYALVPSGGIEASKIAWRMKQAERGLCRYCTRPAIEVDGKQLTACHVHREERAEAAMRSYWRIRADKDLHDAYLAHRRIAAREQPWYQTRLAFKETGT